MDNPDRLVSKRVQLRRKAAPLRGCRLADKKKGRLVHGSPERVIDRNSCQQSQQGNPHKLWITLWAFMGNTARTLVSSGLERADQGLSRGSMPGASPGLSRSSCWLDRKSTRLNSSHVKI